MADISHLTKSSKLGCSALHERLNFTSSHLPFVLRGINRWCLILQHGVHLCVVLVLVLQLRFQSSDFICFIS